MTLKFDVKIDEVIYQFMLLLAFFINFSTAVSSVAIGICSLLVLYQMIKNRRFPGVDKEFLLIFLIYFLIQFVVAVFSINPQISLREFIGELHRCLPFFLAMIYIKDRRQLRNVLIIILFSNVISDCIGIYQWFILNIPRPHALNHTATFFGSFLLMQFPIHFFIANLKLMPKWTRIFAMVACFITIFSLIISLTRGAWLAFIFVNAIALFLEKKLRNSILKLLSVVLILFVTSMALSPLILKSFITLTDPYYSSNTERILMWQSSIAIFLDYPVHGIGQEMFQEVYNTNYIAPEALDRPEDDVGKGHSHPHSNFFKVLSEGGIIGIFSFLFLHSYFLHRFYILHWCERNIIEFSAGLTGILILSGLQLEGLTDTNMNQVPIMREYWLLAGIILNNNLAKT